MAEESKRQRKLRTKTERLASERQARRDLRRKQFHTADPQTPEERLLDLPEWEPYNPGEDDTAQPRTYHSDRLGAVTIPEE